ncbi:NAD-dependent epimerase/dehydratase family protein [Daejeonella oryzae]|uniref:NAD-dependent epimerase/dehydratase family protein n=1 Tax=Daejeonella oryzae TaxID=1122943 RepID=UPI00041FE832|nr:NAD-dependent epimerase/dehydratase family protein [Daejeonella oryzae]
MNYLLTGARGFLGKIILNTLPDIEFITLGRTACDVIADLSVEIPVLPYCEHVLHAAGKAHSLPQTEAEREEFFNVNVKGTSNLLKGLENAGIPKSFIFISSVSVYGRESGILINENESLSAKDPYGLSKIEAEEMIQAWCKKHKVICSILRLPLIAGPNPPGNLGQMIKAIKKGYYFNIGGGRARKSIVLAEDVARIIPMASETEGIYNLTDGYHPSFKELSVVMAEQLNKKNPLNIPVFLAKAMAMAGDIIGNRAPINSSKLKKITSDLTFDDSKARKLLSWRPKPVLQSFRT